MEFNGCARPTVGIEWELQLLEATTLDLFDGILPLLEFFPDRSFVKPEYIQSCVELTSDVAETSDEAVTHLGRTLDTVLKRAADLEMRLCGAGTHAFGRRLALITPVARYRQIERDAGYLAHTQITFSTHVHVGMKSGDDAMRAMARLTPALPAFIALSANSPFWRGHDTGHAAYRHRILAAARNYGLPVAFRDWRDFRRFHDTALRSGMITGIKDIHWDLRPHPDFGTIEFRVMDAASDLETVHLLAALARSMAVATARAADDELERVLPLELPSWIGRENCYRAAHRGLGANFICDAEGRQRPLRGLLEELLEFCEPYAAAIGEQPNLEALRRRLPAGPGYARQIEEFARAGSTRAVTEALCERLEACATEPYPSVDAATSGSGAGAARQATAF